MQHYGRKPREGETIRPATGCEKPFSQGLPVRPPPEERINHSTDRILFDIQKNPPIKKSKRLRESPNYGGSLLPSDLPCKPANNSTNTLVLLEEGELNILA